MHSLNSKLILCTLILVLAAGVFSCVKYDYVSIGAITGPRTVRFGAQGIEYSIADNSSADYTLWKVPEQAQIVSGQGTHIIKVNFGRHPGNICVSLFSKGLEKSADTCIEVSFVDNPNQWNREPDFKGGQRYGAVGFSIDDKGYIGTGSNNGIVYKDFWEYDPAFITWTQKSDLGGTARTGAVGFSIGSKGYIGTGYDGDGSTSIDYLKDFWEYDPVLNQWLQKTDCSDTTRQGAVGFSIGGKGYIGAGESAFGIQSDFYEYDPVANTWASKANLAPRVSAVAFSIGNKGFYGTGATGTTDSTIRHRDFYEYNPQSNQWTLKDSLPGQGRLGAVGFSIGNKGYVGSGSKAGNNYAKDILEYNPALNNWTQKSDFIGDGRCFAIGFSVENKACIGTGKKSSSNNLSDFWVFPQ